jgi:type II secretion system protein N
MKFFPKRLNLPGRSAKKSGLSRHLALHLGAVALLVVVFIVTLIVLFPGQALRDRAELVIYQQAGVRLDIGDLSIAPPLTLTLRNVRWQHDMVDWPPVNIPVARISPRWSSLFGANPGAQWSASLPVGSVQGHIFKDGTLNARLTGVGLAPFLPESFAYPIRGTLDGTIEASGDLMGDSGQAAFEFHMQQAAVAGLEGLGAAEGQFSLGRVILRGALQGRNLRVEELRAADGDLQVEGRGTLLIGNTPQGSRITAQIDLTPAPTLDPNLADLLLLTGVSPDRNGNYRLRLSGSLAAPVLR